ncbi:serine O-acetyltransferase EpsC [Nevskia sp.]|uniref:serine O-acetyltransferase EpsC n=1 Tax=Nevskia sp. TaxID=1929292 RepID=UPI0025F2D102|nr:serine O-acetyltransferase EpsC [Nevskia sp.]
MSVAESGPHWDLPTIVRELREAREDWRHRSSRDRDSGDREFPSPERVRELLRLLRGALFPLRLGPSDLKREGEDFFVGHALDRALNGLVEEARLELASRRRDHGEHRPGEALQKAQARIAEFARSLPTVRTLLDTDAEAAFQGDPAARSVDEVLLCYPGIHALIHHRIAHRLYELDLPLLARIVAELAHSETGIDIHPGASIGKYCFIDHGTGVVIGETAVIGDHVRLYQAVTLGAKRFEAAEDGSLVKGQPRHPVVEDDVVIYAGATILGRITIGRGSSIGGNVWLTRSVPLGSQITQARSEQASSA